METVFGLPSWPVAGEGGYGWVSELGGMLGPVTFRWGEREVSPLHVAPWAGEEEPEVPAMLRALRGDFLCLPFAAERPPHGFPANGHWRQEGEAFAFEWDEGGVVTKRVAFGPGPAVAQRHAVEGIAGRLPVGGHAMLRCETPALVSVSPFAYGLTFPGEFESPTRGGRSSLPPGQEFETLAELRLDVFPGVDRTDDLAQVWSDPTQELAWTAAAFPGDGYAWWALRQTRDLSGTLMWRSQGGRDYAPWRGRHVRCLGLEDVTTYFNLGEAASAGANPASDRGLATVQEFTGRRVEWGHVQGVAEWGADWGAVARLEMQGTDLVLADAQGRESRLKGLVGWIQEALA